MPNKTTLNFALCIAFALFTNAFAAGNQSRSAPEDPSKKSDKDGTSVQAESNKKQGASAPSKLNPTPGSDAKDAVNGVADAANGIVNMFK